MGKNARGAHLHGHSQDHTSSMLSTGSRPVQHRCGPHFTLPIDAREEVVEVGNGAPLIAFPSQQLRVGGSLLCQPACVPIGV